MAVFPKRNVDVSAILLPGDGQSPCAGSFRGELIERVTKDLIIISQQ